ncbi:YdbL family protein [Geomonas sp. Red32]|uniref:DUF1318 domain-containing protein n=1 Tax=Geomonas sp. Red32 TaxID=2912856 RepID=UPI00202CC075|nr:DUF1318 domain-containing protein [Geomonas sp. Red32]MCM0081135.1 YdbL family protein [Geomonas sp. Red32]
MKNIWKLILAVACFFLAACAVITVNVYFPEKAAKEAYKSLDDMLLKPADKGAQPSATPPAPAPAAPEAAKPQSSLFNEVPSFSLVGSAYAAENEADTLAIELSSMPEVVKAYDDMSRRLPLIHQLFANGAIGISNQGLVSVRDKSKVTAQDQAQIAAENQSRKTVVMSMAKAILKLRKEKESQAAINQVMPKAAATFAETRQEGAEPGWWIQLQNGRWVQK